MNKPFEGLKVVELAAVLAGPAVGSFFAELGAEVLKIENKTTRGDVTRSWRLANESKDSPVSAYYAAVNYGKKVMLLDLTDSADHAVVMEEIRKADVLIANFKKGDDEKFGFDYSTVKQVNTGLIYGAITGFGADSDKVAFDVVLQAETGFMSMNGNKGEAPVKMPVAFIDLFAAHQLKEGVLVALLNRYKTGKGAHVSVSLYNAALASLANQATNYLMNDHIPEPIGSLHPNIAPYGEVMVAKDGISMVLAVGSQSQFLSLLRVLDLEILAEDVRFKNNANRVENRKVLQELLQSACSTLYGMDLYQELLANKVPTGLIKNLKQVFDSAEAKSLLLNQQIEGMETTRVATAIFKIQE
jgi:crotonobetainyl-CoA:carnitine CoA-transferase CaiB-like acyl-CoA transferase